ncbi:transposase [Streptomyces sp. DG2A-72]|uniref:IS701 family transposase n=1 Tax=Streptomyces sp. DG2A-72 TaxID=3051386 RepID=UPI00265B9DFD|nr:transposase [Streptomyces sp. DG2A-72]MDO0939365.1 transposase [Streptomyces sp. DG2A-72]
MADQSRPGTLEAARSVPVSSFAQAIFGHMGRVDQRRWAQAYLQGLLTTPGRKSVRRLAAAVSASPTAAMSLQQFVNASPWDWGPARRELTRLAERHTKPRAWTVGNAILPKRGDYSCGVHRRFVPAVGRTINCQVGIGVFVASDEENIPVDWRLLLPQQWTDDDGMRARARIPESLGCRPMWAQVLNLVDTMALRTSRPRVPVVADMSECADVEPLLHGLSRRGHEFLVAAPASLQVVGGSGSRPAVVGGAAADAAHHARAAQDFVRHNGAYQRLAGVERPRRQMQFLSQPVRLPGMGHTYRLFTEWRPGAASPRVWATNLVGHTIDHLVSLTRLHSGMTAAIDSLERDFGLLDFEGRSFPGWHHHVTLASAAYAYTRLSRCAAGDSGWLDLSA